MRQTRGYVASALWAIAVTLMVFGTGDSIRESHNSIWLAWGLFVAVAACVPTGWILVKREVEEHESVTVEQIVTAVDALHHARDEVTSIR